MSRIAHKKLEAWVDETAKLGQPDQVYWVDGGEEERARLTKRAIARGFMIPLDQGKYPGCYYSRSNPNDVARTEHLTYICTRKKEDAGPTNNWMSPEDGYAKSQEIMKGSMVGRTMYVIPFSMGPIGSPFSKIARARLPDRVNDSAAPTMRMSPAARTGVIDFRPPGARAVSGCRPASRGGGAGSREYKGQPEPWSPPRHAREGFRQRALR